MERKRAQMGEPVQSGMSYMALTVMVLGGTLSGLTQTSMNTMLPAVAADFGVSVSAGQWLLTVFMLCMGVTMPVVAFLTRKYDARTLYLAALSMFCLGTLAMATAPVFPVLIAGRVLQGVGTGVIFPLLQVVAFSRFPVEKRGTIMGFIGLAFGFAPNIGPTVGGALQSAYGWRSFFWCLLVFSAVLLVLALLLVERAAMRGADESGGNALDFLSLVLSTLGFGGLLMGCANASSFGFGNAMSSVPMLLGAVVLAVFVWRQLTLDQPFLDMRVFSYRDMTAGTVAICLLFASFIGMALVIPLELQEVHGYSPLLAGVAMLPGTAAALVMNPVSGVMLDRHGPRGICLFGSACLLIGTAAMLRLGEMESLVVVMVCQGVRAVGISSLIAPLTTWSVNALPHAMMPDGSSVTNAFRQMAAALGTSMAVLHMAGGASGAAVTAAGVDHAAWFAFATTLCMAAICFLFVKSSTHDS